MLMPAYHKQGWASINTNIGGSQGHTTIEWRREREREREKVSENEKNNRERERES